MNYCLGFITDLSGTQVLLMEKRRPSWQAGRLNGVGGKVEEGETAFSAMVRECQEETGLDIQEWFPMGAITFEGGQVEVFRAVADIAQAQTLTDEKVHAVALSDALEGRYPLVDSVQDALSRLQETLEVPSVHRPGL